MLAGFCPGLRAQTKQPPGARDLFIEGRDCLDDGKLIDAVRKFREALAKAPREGRPDRTAYFLIATLVKLGDTAEARLEIANFYRNYPLSKWKSDVDEENVQLNGLDGQDELSADPSLEREILRIIINQNDNQGIRIARERLKRNPSDPAVIANFGVIANTVSSQVVPFFATVLINRDSSPNTRAMAIFWLVRQKNTQGEAVQRALIDVMKAQEAPPFVAEALGRLSVAERRVVLDRIAQGSVAGRVVALERIFKGATNAQIRSEVIESLGSIPEPSALTFLNQVASTEKDPVVFLSTVQVITRRNDVDVKTLEGLLQRLSAIPRRIPVRR